MLRPTYLACKKRDKWDDLGTSQVAPCHVAAVSRVLAFSTATLRSGYFTAFFPCFRRGVARDIGWQVPKGKNGGGKKEKEKKRRKRIMH